MRQLATFVAKHEALKQSHYSNASEEERAKVRNRCEKKIINLWGLTFHRGWARLLINRTSLLIRKETFDPQEDEGEEEEGEEQGIDGAI